MAPQDRHRRAHRRHARGRRGQGVVEYALLLILVGCAAVVGLQELGHSGSSAYGHVESALGTTTTSTTASATTTTSSHHGHGHGDGG